ncbi:hypothetical protein SprV_0100001000 [Sparganum proliferum]
MLFQLLGLIFVSNIVLGDESDQPCVGNFTASALNSSSIRATWKKISLSNDLCYRFQITISGGTYKHVLNVSDTSVIFTDLAPSTVYVLNLQALSESGQSIGDILSAYTQTWPSEGLIPSDFRASNLNSSSILVQWKKPTNSSNLADRYKLTIYNSTYKNVLEVEKTFAVIANLEPSCVYFLTVEAIFQSGKPVGISAFTRAETPPPDQPCVGNFTASALNSSSIRATWKKISLSNDLCYRFQITISGGTYKHVLNVSDTSVIFTDLAPSTVYVLNLQALSESGQSIGDILSAYTQTWPSEGLIPSDFRASNLNSSSILVQWKKPTNSSNLADRYKLTIYNSTYKNVLEVEKTFAVIANLEPSSVYFLTVEAIFKNGKPVGISAFTRAETPPPDQPCVGNFTASALNSSSIRATWKKISLSNDLCYRFQITISGGTYKHVLNVSDTSVIFTDLAPSTVYVLNLQALSESGQSIGDILSAYTQTWPSEGLIPSDFRASNLNSSSILVQWKKPTNSSNLADRYKLTIYNSTYKNVLEVEKTFAVIANLEPSSVYFLTVEAIFKNGKPVGISAFTRAETPPPDQPCVGNFTASALNSSSIRATWKKISLSNDLCYRFQITISGGTYKHVLNVSDTSVIFTDLAPSTVYVLNLQALSESGQSIGDILSAYTQTWPSEGLIPSDFRASNLNSSSILVQWKKPTNSSNLADRYKLTIYNSTYKNVLEVEKTFAVIANLEPSSVYFLTVEAIFKNGKPVGISAFTRAETPPPDQPCVGNFTASALNSSSIRATWKKISLSNDLCYRFQITISGGTYKHVLNVSDTSVIFTDLAPSTVYVLNLQALSESGQSIGDILSAYTQTWPSEGLIPSDFRASNLNSSSILVQWKKPTNSSNLADRYKLTIYNSTYKNVLEVEKTFAVIANLEPSSVYFLTVEAIFKNGKPVGISAFTRAETPPPEEPIPLDLVATAINSSAILVTWEAPRDTSKLQGDYRLTLCNHTYVSAFKLSGTKYTITGLEPFSTYNFAVRAIWANSTPVYTAAFASVQTLPRGVSHS